MAALTFNQRLKQFIERELDDAAPYGIQIKVEKVKGGVFGKALLQIAIVDKNGNELWYAVKEGQWISAGQNLILTDIASALKLTFNFNNT